METKSLKELSTLVHEKINNILNEEDVDYEYVMLLNDIFIELVEEME